MLRGLIARAFPTPHIEITGRDEALVRHGNRQDRVSRVDGRWEYPDDVDILAGMRPGVGFGLSRALERAHGEMFGDLPRATTRRR